MIAKFTLNTSSLLLAITCTIFHKLGRFSKKKKRLFLGVLRFFLLGLYVLVVFLFIGDRAWTTPEYTASSAELGVVQR